MKKISPFKSLYYSGLGVLFLILMILFALILNIVPMDVIIKKGKNSETVVVIDTTHQKVVVYDTVSQKVPKQVKTTSNEVIIPVVEVKKETPQPVLDTTK